MRKQETFSMTQEELNRFHVIQLTIQEKIKQKKAAKLLDLSTRQVIRLKKEVKRKGPQGIIHKLRSKPSNNKHSEKVKKKVIKLYKTEYKGFGPTLFEEKLSERAHIEVNCETLRLWLIDAKLWEKQRKVDQHRKWREPKANSGEMIQVDGSHHDWLEGRGPKLVLMGYIDDAMGRVFARFYDYEETLPAMDSFYKYACQYGFPQSIYIDRHSTYKSTAKLTLEEEIEGQKKPQSQFQRALEELGIHVIYALSPQAKGRVERLFRTFQDRVIKEMRLEGIKTKEEANEFLKKYLPKYNRKFEREPKEKSNLHRSIPQALDLKHVLSIQVSHSLRNDNTIRHERKLYQVRDSWKNGRPKKVLVSNRIDGKLYLMDGAKKLHYHEITERPKSKPMKKKMRKLRVRVIPKSSHPWKRPYKLQKEALAA